MNFARLMISILLMAALAGATQAEERILRVAADPENLPFSNDRLEGFENRLAAIVARELNAELVYSWRPQRRSFFRQSLVIGDCDLVVSIPADSHQALTTRPYYGSSYALAYRRGSKFHVRSLDDPQLREARIGVQLAGRNGTPP